MYSYVKLLQFNLLDTESLKLVAFCGVDVFFFVLKCLFSFSQVGFQTAV